MTGSGDDVDLNIHGTKTTVTRVRHIISILSLSLSASMESQVGQTRDPSYSLVKNRENTVNYGICTDGMVGDRTVAFEERIDSFNVGSMPDVCE